MQKKCPCEAITPYCCPIGWKLVLVGSGFTSGAESRYAPVEGEALAVEWGLENTRHYTLGNTKLLVATDHSRFWVTGNWKTLRIQGLRI